MHSEAFPPEKSGGEPSFDFLTRRFLAEKSRSLCSGGSWCGASDHKFSKYDGMETVVFFTVFSPFCFWAYHPNLLLPSVLSHFNQHHQIGTGGKSCYAHILGGNIRRREKKECTMHPMETGSSASLLDQMKSLRAMKEQEKKKKETDPKCGECGQSFKWAHNLKMHMPAKHSSPTKSASKHHCRWPTCEQKYVRRDCLQEHMGRVHLKNHLKHLCPHCNKGFERKG